MPCTTFLVGKNASYDASTMIARTEDSSYEVKKAIFCPKNKQPKRYKCVISHLEIELPENPMNYTATPNVDPKEGIWAASGINEANVGMTATETITTNALVMGADPYVRYDKKTKKAGGIGEEDFVVLVLPYVHSAKEGAKRLGSLLEQYGTYESNGIAFNDKDEVWWLETIGGHHWMARKVPDDCVVVMPNQLGIDAFDFEDALGLQKNYMCDPDLKDFMERNFLNLNQDGSFNPRKIFGSHSDSDHIYNTPRAWFMSRYLTPTSHIWDGENAEFTPESDNIPWNFVPEHKITVEDVKYLLSSHYQGTDYDPYSSVAKKPGFYRSIGISKNNVLSICQIRGYMPEEFASIQWISFASTTFNSMVPIYTNCTKMPSYLSNVKLEPSTENFYWTSRMIAALSDPIYSTIIQPIERYQKATANASHRIINEYDKKMLETNDYSLTDEANKKLCDMVKEEAVKVLGTALLEASKHMKNTYNRADN